MAFTSVCLCFIFHEAGAEWSFLGALCVCSLGRLWVGREISCSCGHIVSLVNACVGDTDGANPSDDIYIMLEEHQSPPSLLLSFKLGMKPFYCPQTLGLPSLVIAFSNIS